MASDDYPWEPPVAGTEAEALVGALDRLRTTFRWKADDLDAAGLRTRIGASSLTLGGLLKHLARAEDEIFTVKLSGAPRGAPWDTAPGDAGPDWDFDLGRRRHTGRALRAVGRRRRAVAGPARRGDCRRRARSAGPHAARATASMPTCAGWSATSSRSTAGTPGMPT